MLDVSPVSSRLSLQAPQRGPGPRSQGHFRAKSRLGPGCQLAESPLPAHPGGRRPVGSSLGCAPCRSPRCRTSRRRSRTGAGSARSDGDRGRRRTGRRACAGRGLSARAWCATLGAPFFRQEPPQLCLFPSLRASPPQFPQGPRPLTRFTGVSGTFSPTPFHCLENPLKERSWGASHAHRPGSGLRPLHLLSPVRRNSRTSSRILVMLRPTWSTESVSSVCAKSKGNTASGPTCFFPMMPGGRRPSRVPTASQCPPRPSPPQPGMVSMQTARAQGPAQRPSPGDHAPSGPGGGGPGGAEQEALTCAHGGAAEQQWQALHALEGAEVVHALVQAVHPVLVLRQDTVSQGHREPGHREPGDTVSRGVGGLTAHHPGPSQPVRPSGASILTPHCHGASAGDVRRGGGAPSLCWPDCPAPLCEHTPWGKGQRRPATRLLFGVNSWL